MRTFKSFTREDVKEPVQPWDPRSEGEQRFKHMHNPINHKNLVPGVTDQEHVFNGGERRYDPPTASYEKSADAAAYDKNLTTEEIENLDELKRTTLASYVRKASHDVATKSAATGRYADRANKVRDEVKKGDYSNYQQGKKDDAFADKMFNKSWKRRKGIDTAVSKLAHTAKVNANEEFVHLDEADLSKIDRKTLEALTQLHKYYGQKDPRSKESAERGEAELKRRDNEKKEKMKESTLPPHLAKMFNKKGDFKDPKKHAIYKGFQDKMAKRDLGVDAKDHKSEYGKMRAGMGVDDKATTRKIIGEKHLTPAEMKKREQIAKAMGRENPKMNMSKKMAIATASAKKLAEEALGDHAGLAKYADEHGRIDKEDLHTAAKHIKSGNMKALDKHLHAMDTDPRDKALEYVNKKHYEKLGYRSEEVEHLDEISSSTLVSYSQKAHQQVKGNQPSDPDKLRKRTNREQGIKLAFNKHYQFRTKVPATTNEEVEQIDELTGIKTSPLKKLGYVIKAGKRMTKTAPHEIANDPTTARKFTNTLKTLKKMNKEELELDEAKRGRPRKDGSTKPAGSDDEEGGREHIIVQLRKAENLRGSEKHVEFNDNTRHILNPAHVKKALDMHSGMRPSDKETFEKRLASSHASFTSAVKGEPAPKPKPKISLGGRVQEMRDPSTTRADKGPESVETIRGADGMLRVVKRKGVSKGTVSIGEAKDLNAKNVKAAVKHDCATHVEHAQWGFGNCIPEMHTIEEISEGVGYVTHYDIMFEHGIEQNVPIESLRILASEEHGHTPRKSMKEALIGNQHKIDANHNGKVDAQDFKILKGKQKFNKFSKKKMNEAEEMTAATVKAAADTQYAKGQASKENMQQDSINKMKTDPLASKESVTLPPTQGNKPIGGDTVDPARVGGKYSMEEERLENLFNSLSEENQEKFAAMLETEEGLDELLDFAEKQGF